MKNVSNQTVKNKILTIPNLLSLFRIGLIPLFIWLYSIKQEYLWTGFILLLSGITDIVDGWIARHFNMVSNVGKVLDPIADKLTQGMMLLCLIERFPLIIMILVLLIIKEMIAAFMGLIVIHKTGQVNSARWHGKVATLILYIMMIIHVVFPTIPEDLSNIIILICIGMMIISLILYNIQNMKTLKGAKREEGNQ